jgi:hypothetical protein
MIGRPHDASQPADLFLIDMIEQQKEWTWRGVRTKASDGGPSSVWVGRCAAKF